ncbi:MAG: hypothetical protein IPM32_10875 [Ignavibacteriae bacterium]|nr:hypothetical protein [Ignavibacteriota bacterium]
MLPDFINAKNIFRDELFNYFSQRVKINNPFAVVPSKAVVEGDGAKIIREDGDEAPFDFKRISTTIEHEFKNIPNQTVDDIYKIFDKMAADFARQQFQIAIEEIDKSTKKSGNRTEGPLTPKLFFETIKMRLIPFNEKGETENQMLILHPDKMEDFEKMFKEIEENEELRKEYDEIINEKKREWRDRENSRKLVD